MGGLAALGVALSPLSLICLLITVGFAVDFTAHIVLRMEACDPAAPAPDRVLSPIPASEGQERKEVQIAETIRWMGWPLVQAGATTAAGVLCLSPVPCDLMRTFWQSVCLVVGLGLAHAFLIIPLAYTALPSPAKPRHRALL